MNRPTGVEFHGGTISVDPGYRAGARSIFTLAAKPSESADQDALPEASCAGAELAR
ncbi:hypothetical protein [Streptomyces xanthophaeus]